MTIPVRTDAATEIVLTVDVYDGIPAHEVVELVASVLSGINIVGYMAVSLTSGRLILPVQATIGKPRMVEEFPRWVRLSKLHYGSPVQMVIDVQPLLHFLTGAGFLAFLAGIGKLIKDGASTWEILERAGLLRRNANEARDKARAMESAGQSGDKYAEQARDDDQYFTDAVEKALDPLIAAMIRESGVKFLDRSAERGVAEELRDTGRKYIEYHEQEIITAGATLKTKTIRVEIN